MTYLFVLIATCVIFPTLRWLRNRNDEAAAKALFHGFEAARTTDNKDILLHLLKSMKTFSEMVKVTNPRYTTQAEMLVWYVRSKLERTLMTEWARTYFPEQTHEPSKINQEHS